jgi:hypothetical protein
MELELDKTSLIPYAMIKKGQHGTSFLMGMGMQINKISRRSEALKESIVSEHKNKISLTGQNNKVILMGMGMQVTHAYFGRRVLKKKAQSPMIKAECAQ